jgi:MoaA/NifB/PqqE/SkfB family radical SAM enzyme
MRFLEKIRWAGKVLRPTCRWNLPEQVIFFITDRCNLACAHCFYWANLNKETNEATLQEIDRFSRSLGSFSFLTLTGGEPFLRDDIPKIVGIFNKNNSISSISIPTNGFFTERILKTTECILRDNKNVDLTVKISLDGLEEKHDAIRGERGVFSKAVDTYHGLVKLKEKNPRLKVGIIITYSALNQENMPEMLDYIKEKLNPDMISLNFVRGNVKDPKIKKADVANYLKAYKSALSFLLAKKNKQADLNHRFFCAYKSKVSEMVAKSIKQNRYLYPCYAGRLLCVIDSSLNVYPCEMIGKGFGNLRAYGYDFRKLWFSRDAESLRREIQKSNCYCTYECNLQISAFFNLKGLLSLAPRTLGFNS